MTRPSASLRRGRHAVVDVTCAVAVAIVVAACGDDDAVARPPGSDGAIASRALGSCASPIVLDGVDGTTVSVALDTTNAPPGRALLETGPACVLDPGEDVPQAVVAYRVPGVGRRTIRFTTDNDGTDPDYATTIVVRKNACDGPSPDVISTGCFDTVQDGPRASGSVGADGGDTLFFVITGNRFLVDAVGGAFAGRVRLDVTSSPGAVPTIHSASVRVFADEPTEVEVRVEGEDRDGDATGLVVVLLDAAEAPVPWAPMGSGSTLGGPTAVFDDPPASFERFARRVALAPPPAAPVATAWVRLLDAAGGLSDRLSVDVVESRWQSRDEPCDDVSLVCTRELECRDDSCQPSASVAAVCASAESLTLDAPMLVATSVVRTGMLPASPGTLTPSCTDGSSAESAYRVSVPDGVRVDLVVRETAESSGRLGLWLRRDCTDSASELACSIDRDAMRHRFLESRDIEPGDYWVAVDGFPFGGTRHEESPYSLTIALRPILVTGASCDPAEVLNRCALGACPAGSSRCP